MEIGELVDYALAAMTGVEVALHDTDVGSALEQVHAFVAVLEGLRDVLGTEEPDEGSAGEAPAAKDGAAGETPAEDGAAVCNDRGGAIPELDEVFSLLKSDAGGDGASDWESGTGQAPDVLMSSEPTAGAVHEEQVAGGDGDGEESAAASSNKGGSLRPLRPPRSHHMIKRDRRSMSMDAGAVSLALREQQKSQTPNPGRRPPPSRRGGGVVAVGAARKFPRAKPPMPSALGNMVVASSNDVDRAKAVQSRRKEQAEAAMRSQRSAKEQSVYDHVAGELLKTETDYVRDLKIIIEVFKKPLEEKELIDSRENAVLFGNIELLLGVNEELLSSLKWVAQEREKKKAKAAGPSAPLEETDERVILRVMIEKEQVFKTIRVSRTTTGLEAGEMLVKKAIMAPGASVDVYKGFVLVMKESGKVVADDESVLESCGHKPGDPAPNLLFKLPTNTRARSEGEALLQMASYLKMYSAYCSNQVACMTMMRTLQKENEEFAAFCKAALRNKRCRKLDLMSFLIMPLQRVCKYPLLLRELLNATPQDHVDYVSLSKAMDQIVTRSTGAAVMTINNKKAENEANQYMMELQNCIDAKGGFTILAPSRKFVSKGEATHVAKKKTQPAHYFLFNDLIVVTSPKDEDDRYKLITSMELKKALINDVEIAGLEHAFSIVRVEKSSKLTLAAQDERTKLDLMETLRRIVAQDVYNEWVAKEMQAGKSRTCDKGNDVLPFEEWREQYADMLF